MGSCQGIVDYPEFRGSLVLSDNSMMWEVMNSSIDSWRCLGNDLDYSLTHLVLDGGIVVSEEAWRLPQSLEKVSEPLVTEVVMVRERRVMLLPWGRDFVSLALVLDLLDEIIVHRGLILSDSE